MSSRSRAIFTRSSSLVIVIILPARPAVEPSARDLRLGLPDRDFALVLVNLVGPLPHREQHALDRRAAHVAPEQRLREREPVEGAELPRGLLLHQRDSGPDAVPEGPQRD